MLHKTSEMRGFHIVAIDGEIGHVDDFLVDETGQSLVYLVVNTSNWIGGKSVLIASATIGQIDSSGRKIFVRLTRAYIEGAPSVETAQIDPAETLPALWIM
jgi:uncharacterized protein YrrD